MREDRIMDIFRLQNQYTQLYYEIIKMDELGTKVPPSLRLKLKTLEHLLNDDANAVKKPQKDV
jgi:hypothetical protein